jgi:RsiW-degrading membrane proteinase PrsW (M82 family)
MKKQGLDYLILITGSVFFIIFLSIYQGNRLKSLLTLISFIMFYIMWGFYHHFKDESLNLKTVIEYIFIGFTILLFLIVIFTL